jgi:hypothetical protein
MRIYIEVPASGMSPQVFGVQKWTGYLGVNGSVRMTAAGF